MNKRIATIWLIIFGFILIAGSAYWYYVDDIKPYVGQSPWISYLANDSEAAIVEVPAGIAKRIGWPVKSEGATRIPLRGLSQIQLAKLGAYFAYPEGIPTGIETALNKNEIPPELESWTTLPYLNHISDWKTYRNEKYGFEVKYPNEWVLKDTSDGAGYAFYEVSIYQVDPDEFCSKIQKESSSGFLCGVAPVLQIYKQKNGEIKKIAHLEEQKYITGDVLRVSQEVVDQILSTFKFMK